MRSIPNGVGSSVAECQGVAGHAETIGAQLEVWRADGNCTEHAGACPDRRRFFFRPPLRWFNREANGRDSNPRGG